jgi:hypothetical protein
MNILLLLLGAAFGMAFDYFLWYKERKTKAPAPQLGLYNSATFPYHPVVDMTTVNAIVQQELGLIQDQTKASHRVLLDSIQRMEMLLMEINRSQLQKRPRTPYPFNRNFRPFQRKF